MIDVQLARFLRLINTYLTVLYWFLLLLLLFLSLGGLKSQNQAQRKKRRRREETETKDRTKEKRRIFTVSIRTFSHSTCWLFHGICRHQWWYASNREACVCVWFIFVRLLVFISMSCFLFRFLNATSALLSLSLEIVADAIKDTYRHLDIFLFISPFLSLVFLQLILHHNYDDIVGTCVDHCKSTKVNLQSDLFSLSLFFSWQTPYRLRDISRQRTIFFSSFVRYVYLKID